ncbi:nucleotidyltransferase [Paenibacillus campi]|uniref:nucleotidyltransferase n=1 Tax=Paenibacillus campi TaxID=3106031 RepID=UPI002AFFC9AF|nr:nucleotidyltransferase [Paenibacillus sp. SGZ-1014]
MATTVISAFNEFMKDHVNLDANVTISARKSRNWLIDQIDKFDEQDGFPNLYSDIDIHFGSFARRTKIRELDDIDLMFGLSAQGSTYLEVGDGKVEITVPDSVKDLYSLCHDYTDKLNSRKVINKFVASLKGVSQYENAAIKRNQEAATLKLNTYSWIFDIVPCFFTTADLLGRTYYLIPDGNGHWKKTDPRMDKDNILRINKKHEGNVLDVIRLIKYWNEKAAMPTIGSYLIECLLLSYFDNKSNVSSYVDIEIINLLLHIHTAIFDNVADPKNIQGNLNYLSYEDKQKISQKAYSDYVKAFEARQAEQQGDHATSIQKWGEVLGNDFPKYTG